MSITKIVEENNSKSRLDKIAAEMFIEFSRTQLKKWILEGRVLVNNELAKPKDMVFYQDEITIDPVREKKVSWEPQEISFEILDDNKDFIIVNKPSGLVMHPGSGCYDGTLANALLFKYPELKHLPRSGIVHRLDKDTSGVLVVARSEEFRNHFINMMQSREIIKKYLAISSGSTLGSFEINEPLGRDKKNRTKIAIRDDGKEALTFVKLLENLGGYSLLDILIKTGRTHQIRVHLASKKLPIIGDGTYNPRKIISKDTSVELVEVIRNFPRQALHAHQISFFSKNKEDIITYDAPVPEDMENLIENLKKL